MSEKLHVCKICGKKFATQKGVCGHLKIHSGLQRIWGHQESRVCSISTSAKDTSIESETLVPLCRGHKATSSLSPKESSSFMTEIERHEMNEAAMSLLMFSERVSLLRNLSPGDVAMDLELELMQEKTIHCVEPKQESSEVFSHSGFEKSSTCSDVVAPLRIKLQMKREGKSSYKCKICGKSFERSQALGGHQTLHRSIKGQLARKKEDFEGGNSLSVLTDSGAKKAVPQLSCFEVSREELIELRDTNVKEHCVVPKQDFSELFSQSGFGKSGANSDVVAQSLPSLLKRTNHRVTPATNAKHTARVFGVLKLKVAAKHFTDRLACKKKDLEDW